MHATPDTRCTAFAGPRRIAAGELRHVALKAQQALQSGENPVLIFEDRSSQQVEVDLRGSSADLLKRLAEVPAQLREEVTLAGDGGAGVQRKGPGRPKLGVVAREVTLLPRHWQWLAAQPGGASVALRRLVEDARRSNAAQDRRRAAQESAYRFMAAMAGDEAGFEDAARALFAGDAAAFEERIAAWPEDVRDHAALLAADALRG
jgi:hypothetical protein